MMIAPELPADFFPELPEEERISRWFVLEEEALEAQCHDVMLGEEPEMPRPFWMRDCTHEGALRMRGYL